MALQPGSTLGGYEILGSIGAGGMGEVYRARDVRLGRVVALKTLSGALSADPDRRARFEREARAVAALNHPGIVTIHSIEEANGTPFLTMELVEGRPLADILPRQGWPIDRLLAIAIPLADAVAAAHARGITHRDLKPANVIVMPDGRVKVLDFGLAKLRQDTEVGALANQPTALGTGAGHILGTVSYMSPEQAEGRPIDERSDLFSLGVILYELATGERPFTGETPVSILSSIIKDTPRVVNEIRPHLPRALTRVVKRALVKDVDHRYQSAKDLRNDLEELKQDLDSGVLKADAAVLAGVQARRSRVLWIAAAGLFALAAVASVLSWLARQSPPVAPPLDVKIDQLTTAAGPERHPSLSPDGKWVVYSASGPTGQSNIFLQSVGGKNPINLTKDAAASDTEPVFSPDGEQIAFVSSRQGGGLFVMGRTGEFVRRVSANGVSPSWSPDGKFLVYATVFVLNPYGRAGIGELWVVPVTGGTARQIYKGDAVQPAWSPHGTRIAFWSIPAEGGSQRDIFTIPASGGTPVAVTNDAALDASPAWSADGRFLYFVSDRGGTLNLWRVPIDEASGAARGAPEPVTTPTPFDYEISVSADGHRIAFAAVTLTSNVQRWTLDPTTGTVVGMGAAVTSGSTYRANVTVAPDGSHIATATQYVHEDLSVFEPDGTHSLQITNDLARNRWPAFSPDGQQIVFSSNRAPGGVYDVWIVNIDGSGLRQLTDGLSISYLAWSPKGDRIAGCDARKYDTWIVDPRRTMTDQLHERLPTPPADIRQFIARSWSPDGRHLVGPIGSSGIGTYDLDSKTYRLELGNIPGISSPVRWLDSTRILFISQRRLMLLDTATHQVRQVLSAAPDNVSDFATTGDGRQLFITRGTAEADIWMATIK